MTTGFSLNAQKDMILTILTSFLEDIDNLGGYLEHVGFDLRMVSASKDLPQAWLGFYRIRRGCYDVERACRDLARWPPIAARIHELRAGGAMGPDLAN